MLKTHYRRQIDNKTKKALYKEDLFVDNSIEISNISITARDLIDTYHLMTLILQYSDS